MVGRRFLIGTIFCLVSSPWVLAGDEAELPLYFSGLRERGLFRVAEEYALSRLTDSELPPAQRAILAVELSKVFAAHAAEATSVAEANELWTRAEETLTPLLSAKDNPRWAAVRSRHATLLCDRALVEFWQSRLDPDSVAKRQSAVQATQSALTAMQSIAPETSKPSKPSTSSRPKPTANPKSTAEGSLSSVELRHLGDEIDYLIVRMNLNLAQLLPIGANRAAALMEAEKGGTALARHANSDFVWPARLARVEALRLQGDPEKAIAYAQSLLAPELTRELADALVAEQARARLVLNTPTDAIQLILEHGEAKQGPSCLSPELRAIVIECLLASSAATPNPKDKALAADLEQQIAAQQKMITGPWRAYADAVVARSTETRQYGEKLAAIVREGRLAAQRHDWSAATIAYEQAAQEATALGKLSLAAEFEFIRASLAIEAGQLELASHILAEYTTRFPNDPRAADAHLLAAWTLGRLNNEEPSPARRSAYIEQLKDHVTRYPHSPTQVEAQWSLAVDAIRHQEWVIAIDSLEAIPADHPRATEAAAQLPYCYEQGFSQVAEKSDLPAWEQRADSAFRRQIATWPHPPAGWSLSQSENALRWARVLLRFRDRQYAEAEQLLSHIGLSHELEVREMARDGSPLNPAWGRLLPAATQLRVISLAGLGRTGEAEKLLLSEATTSADDLLATLSGLSEIASSLNAESRHALGRIQLAAARRLDEQRASLSPEKATLVDRCLAEAYVATGDLPEALAIYETLLKAHPRDRQLLQAIGTLSLQHGQPADQQRAKSAYRQLESCDPAGSPAWLRTRLQVARVSLQLGEIAESEKLLKVTRILYPELGGAELKSEYGELEKDVLAAKRSRAPAR